jgi:hypothetical protein
VIEGTRHRRRWIVFIALGVVVLVAATAAWLLLGGGSPRPVTVDEARRRTDGATASTAPKGEFGPPVAGVYLYRGAGTEKTSFPAITEQQGPSMPATVIPDGTGCWRFRIDYNTHHWQDWRFCASPSGIVSTGGRSFSRREFGAFKVDNTSTFTCADPEVFLAEGMEAGDSFRGVCTGASTATGGSTRSAGSTTYLGDEDLEVGGRTVRTRHLRYQRALTGAQDGTEQADWWADPSTMLPIRNRHRVSVRTQVGTLTVTYTEVSTYELTSLALR